MKSKWFDLKKDAVAMRKMGISVRDIEKRLGVARSTLSGWLRNVVLSETQKIELKANWDKALVRARAKAVVWHNEQKKLRLQEAENQAARTLGCLDTKNKSILDLAAAILYLGEGAKATPTTSIGNSNPMILKFFIAVLVKNYAFDTGKLTCVLHLRADQDPRALKRYWSRELGLPVRSFVGVHIDKRTLGRPTYPDYKGVCVLQCGTVAIQRKLMYLSSAFCEKVIKEMRG